MFKILFNFLFVLIATYSLTTKSLAQETLVYKNELYNFQFSYPSSMKVFEIKPSYDQRTFPDLMIFILFQNENLYPIDELKRGVMIQVMPLDENMSLSDYFNYVKQKLSTEEVIKHSFSTKFLRYDAFFYTSEYKNKTTNHIAFLRDGVIYGFNYLNIPSVSVYDLNTSESIIESFRFIDQKNDDIIFFDTLCVARINRTNEESDIYKVGDEINFYFWFKTPLRCLDVKNEVYNKYYFSTKIFNPDDEIEARIEHNNVLKYIFNKPGKYTLETSIRSIYNPFSDKYRLPTEQSIYIYDNKDDKIKKDEKIYVTYEPVKPQIGEPVIFTIHINDDDIIKHIQNGTLNYSISIEKLNWSEFTIPNKKDFPNLKNLKNNQRAFIFLKEGIRTVKGQVKFSLNPQGPAIYESLPVQFEIKPVVNQQIKKKPLGTFITNPNNAKKGQTVVLKANVVDPDGGDITLYRWFFLGKNAPRSILTTNNSTSVVFPNAGIYSIGLIAKDDENQISIIRKQTYIVDN